MKLLVTGGLGFIGSAVVRRAIRLGCDVLNFDAETYSANRANVGEAGLSPRYRFVHADICDVGRVASILRDFSPDAVLHLAAESHVDRSIDGPLAFVRTNVEGTASLLEAARAYCAGLDDARRAAFRFHHVSTDEVYGSLGPTGRFTEATPYAPRSPYSATKAASDMLVRAWGETYGLPYVITNCSNNYGPHQYPEKLIPKTIIAALSGDPIQVYGRGENVRDWLHVEDHVEALLCVLERGRPGETYNIGGDAEARNIDIVTTLCRHLDERRPRAGRHEDLITFVADRPGHDFRYAIDCAKLRDELGWRPRRPLSQGLRETVDWYLANKRWWRPLVENSGVRSRVGLGRAA